MIDEKSVIAALLYVNQNGPTHLGQGISHAEAAECIRRGFMRSDERGAFHLTDEGLIAVLTKCSEKKVADPYQKQIITEECRNRRGSTEILDCLLRVSANEQPKSTKDRHNVLRCVDLGWVFINNKGEFEATSAVKNLLADFFFKVVKQVLHKTIGEVKCSDS